MELLLNWKDDGDDEVDVRCLSVNFAKALVAGSAPPAVFVVVADVYPSSFHEKPYTYLKLSQSS
jgi:hypothetical protein